MAQYASLSSLGRKEDEQPPHPTPMMSHSNMQGTPTNQYPQQQQQFQQPAPLEHKACFQITSPQDKESFIASNRVVVIDIGAEWCGPCQQVGPKFEKLASRYFSRGECGFAKENADLGITPSVTSIPFFEFYVNGQRVDTYNGASIEQVEQRLGRILSRA